MRFTRVYTPRQNIRIGSSVLLEEKDLHHIRNSLRLKKGDKIIIFNGDKEFLAELNMVRNDFITARVKEIIKDEQYINKRKFTIYIGLLRSNKIDDIIKMLTEIGVDTIIPVETEYSQVKKETVSETKIKRWNNLAVAAAKQSQRISIPEIKLPVDFLEMTNSFQNYQRVFILSPKEKNSKFVQYKDTDLSIALVIGPEGGFSPKEMERFNFSNIEKIKISDLIMRSETASVAALSILKFSELT